jgi:SagB-type dehydrogenase family enzyme
MDKEEEAKIGELYQESTKYHRDRMPGDPVDFRKRPGQYKLYQDSFPYKLPDPDFNGKKTLEQLLKQRRSFREFSSDFLSQQEVSTLLWASQGITYKEGNFVALRTAPSAGALYPVETYLCINNVEGLERGLYHYVLEDHILAELITDDYRARIARAGMGQETLERAAVVFIWTAVVRRSTFKYRQRGYRYIYLDAGHIGQNLSLAAEELGLGCCMVGAFYDDELNQILHLDGKDETVVYLGAVGKK